MEGYCNQYEVVRRTDDAKERREWLDGIRCQPKELRGAAIYELLNAALGETEKAAGC